VDSKEACPLAKAKLSVVLKADETVVAESDDPLLWQHLLGVIQRGEKFDSPKDLGASSRTPQTDNGFEGNADHGLQRFARTLGLGVDVVEGALTPTREAPYLHLNPHNWEAFKKAVPARGATSVSAAALAGTMLALWIREAKLDVAATQALTAQVLATIGQRDPNAHRGINNTKWLQARAGGSFIVNPAEISKAVELTRSFCSKRAPGDA
jgi:hypothetical protein